MYVLISKKHGGVYAVRNKDGLKTVQIFEEEDDAIRYHGLLAAEDFDDTLEVTEVDAETVAQNCSVYGYNYCYVEPDDIVFPPK
jgi:anthranilate/para-aminobenzoate synthase component II